MKNLLLAQELADMVRSMESLLGSFDWFIEPGDDQAAVVRRTYSANMPLMIAALGRQMAPMLALMAPAGMAPWRAIVTAEGVTLRQM